MTMAHYTCRYNIIHWEEEEKIGSYKLKITTYSNDILLASDFISAAVCTKLFQ